MARKRMIDPSIWTDEGMAELTPRQQLLYIGLFSNADDDGRLKGSAASIRLHLPGVYAEVSADEVEADLAAVLREMRQLVAYEVEGKRYLAFLNYRAWQKIDRPMASTLPAPGDPSRSPHDDSTNDQRGIVEDAANARPQKKGIEEKLVEEKSEKEKGDEARPRAVAADAAPPEPLRAVPKRNRAAEVIDALRDLGLEVSLTSRDGKAIKECGAEPSEIAAAYSAAFHGTWGDDYVRENLSLHLVIDRLGGYRASRRPRASPPKGPAPADPRRYIEGPYGHLIHH